MKKTLIALALAATAASGSAMAWTTNGTGGSVDLGGTLTPDVVVVPWEVKTGDAINNLDATISQGQSSVDIAVSGHHTLLGVRVADATNKTFTGQSGISPQISYGGALDFDSYTASLGGFATLSLEVQDKNSSSRIGVLSTTMYTGAQASYVGQDSVPHRVHVYAASAGDAFFGGLPKDSSAVAYDSWTIASSVGSEYVDNYTDQGAQDNVANVISFDDNATSYSAFYYAGIRSGATLNITLDSPASGNVPVEWKASLPITVSYQ
ncbi:TPA: hypothetical protein J1W43_004403 [Escherichia coli]|nr:hypothetical protein [Escherichia coli]HBA8270676.1 hypothetical protein [Escherichia coli]HBA8733201.1 hypothetical protein [Escherichia coli]HBB8629388.1 hypothetical protein [Escherichia coli]